MTRAAGRRLRLNSIIAACGLVTVAACSPSESGGDGGGGDTQAASECADATEIEIATWGSPDHVSITSFVPAFEEELAERSDGRITVNHVPSGVIAEDGDMPVAVPRGTVEMGWTTINLWSGVVPSTGIFDSPLVGALSMEELNEAMEDPDGLGGLIESDLEDAGAIALGWAQLGPAAIVSQEPVRVPDDLAGLVIRTYSEGGEELIQAAGGSSVSLAFAEVYTALQVGSADGAHSGLQGIASQRYHEVADYAMVPSTFFGTPMAAWVGNKEWFESFCAEDQEIISEAADAAAATSREAIIEDRDALIQLAEDEGMEFFGLTSEDPEFAEWEELVAPIAEADRESYAPELVEALEAAG